MWRKGFTLIELIVVIAIIAILAAIIAPNAFKAIEKSKTSATLGELTSIKTGALSYFADIGGYPPSCNTPALCSQIATVAGNATFIQQSNPVTPGWDGPYLQKWPIASKFNGNYNWNNTANTQTFNTGNPANERYVQVTGTATSMSTNVVNAMDRAMDGGTTINLTGGELRGTVGSDVVFLVSRDGPVAGQ